MSSKKGKTEPPAAKPASQRGLSVADLAEQYDFPTKVAAAIRRALKRLPPGKVWSDVDMRSECGMSTGRVREREWRDITEQDEFLDHQFQVNDKGKVFWAQPRTVTQACHVISGARGLRQLYEEKST